MKSIILTLSFLIPNWLLAQGAKVVLPDSPEQRSKELRAAWTYYQRESAGLEDAVAHSRPGDASKRIATAQTAQHAYSERIVQTFDAAISTVDRQLEVERTLIVQAQTMLTAKNSSDADDQLKALDKWITRIAANDLGDKRANAGVEAATERLRENLANIVRLHREQDKAVEHGAEVIRGWVEILNEEERELTSERESLSLSRSLEVQKREHYDDYFSALRDLVAERERKAQ
jgi:hypothetical protein